MMERVLEGKVIVVTGGCGLIGSRFVTALADAGATAVAADIDAEKASALAQRLMDEQPDRRVEGAACDITDAVSLDRMRDDLLRRHGRIDGLVNNAYPRNARYGSMVEDVTFSDFRDNLSMHVGGYFLTMQRLLPALREAPKGGAIVNMGSIYGVVAPRFEVYDGTRMTMPVEYAAIKSGVLHLTRYFAQYLKRDAVRVNAISPGGIEDGQPQSFLAAYNAHGGTKGMLDADDLVGTLVYLMGDGARFVTGQNIIVDDGWSL